MRFGIYLTMQLPRPWADGDEQALFDAALDQIELADRLGIDYAWVPEQHFLEEYSHSSAPEVLLAAASQRTTRIRLAHGVVLLPPPYNHPVRVAERIATLDLLSGGRVDFGTGNSKSRMEIEGFGIDLDQRHAMSLEALTQIVDMLSLAPYPGFAGEFFSLPPRNVVPKPVQRPHPPLWIAASDDATIHRAAQLGLGVLTHGFHGREEAQRIADDYYETFKRECVPIGHAVNPNIASMTAFYCHRDAEVARSRGRGAQNFATYSTRHYYSFGRHVPGVTNIGDLEQKVTADYGGELPILGRPAIGTPEEIYEHLAEQAAAGVDQIVLGHQAGRMSPAEIRESLELFGTEVLPRFATDEHRRRTRKEAELAPYVRAAFERKAKRAEAPGGIEPVDAYGRSRLDGDTSALPSNVRDLLDELREMRSAAMRHE